MRTFVTFCNGMIGVVCPLSASYYVAPPSADLCACWDGDDIVVFVPEIFVAGEASVIDVLNRIVRIRCSDSFELTLVYTVD
jgi:hypothetical protein